MTDNRTTELLCKLLEERGLNCQTHYLHTSWYVGPKLYEAVDNLDGTLTVGSLTPEQAIAATLGESDESCYLMRDGKKFPVELDCGFVGIMPIAITVAGFRYLLEVPDGE